MDTHLGSKNPLDKVYIPDIKERAEFKDEWKRLLVFAFADAGEITVGPRLSGYSDARIWIVTTSTGSQEQTFAVKMAQRPLIKKEFDNSGKVTGGGLYGNPVKAEKLVLPDSSRLGLIIFTYQNDTRSSKSTRDSSHTNTLLKYLEKCDATEIEHIFKKVFARRGNTFERSVQYVNYYDRLLFEHYRVTGLKGSDENATLINATTLHEQKAHPTASESPKRLIASQSGNIKLQNFHLEKIEENTLTLSYQIPGEPNEKRDGTFRVKIKYDLAPNQSFQEEYDKPVIDEPLYGQNPKTRFELFRDCERDVLRGATKLKKSFKYQNIRYPNPIDFLDTLLFNPPVRLKCALTHGDLNLQNILILLDDNSQVDLVLLIDFADTALGPILLDFQWLEVQVILRLVAPALQNHLMTELITFFKRLHDCENDHSAYFDKQFPKLKMPYVILRQLRRLAKEHLLSSDWSEYYHGLVLALLGTLRFRRLVEKKELVADAPRVAFFSAATLLCWTTNVLQSNDWKNIQKELQTTEFEPVDPIIEPSVVIQPPTIAKDSIPQWLFPGQKFMLRGTGSAGKELHRFVDQTQSPQPLAVTGEGNWESEISFDRAGTYHVRVQYAGTTITSTAAAVVVQPLPSIDPKRLPKNIYVGQPFAIGGTAYPHAQLEVLAGSAPPIQSTADENGAWEVKTAKITKTGTQTVVARYLVDKSVTSNAVAIPVYDLPMIDKNSLLQPIRVGKPHSLFGYAPPDTKVEVKTDREQKPLATAIADANGGWHAVVGTKQVGKHNLTVCDQSSDITSAPLLVEVLRFPRAIYTSQFLWGVLLSFVVLIVISGAFFPDIISELGVRVGLIQPTPIPTIPPVVDPSWNTTAEAACAAIQAWKLTASGSEGSGPYSYAKDGKLIGFDIDLLELVINDCQSRGFDLKGPVEDYVVFKQIEVSRRGFEVQDDEVQVVVGSVSRTPDRCDKAEAICTNPYAEDEQALAVKSDAIDNYCDPDLKKVVVITRTTGATTFNDYITNCRQYVSNFNPITLTADSRLEALQWVNDGTVDAYKTNVDLLKYAIDDNQDRFPELKIVPGGPPEPLVMWLRNDRAGLRTLINETIDNLKEDGRAKEICERHFAGYGKDCTKFPIVRAPQEFLLGSALAESGGNTPLAFEQRLGFKFALEVLNPILEETVHIRLRSKPGDVGSDRETAITAFAKLIKERLIAIIGPTYSFQLFAILGNDEIKASSILIISTSATADDATALSDHNIRTSVGVKEYAKYAVVAALEENSYIKDSKKVVLAYLAGDEFTQSETRAFTDTLSSYSIESKLISYTNDITTVVSDVLQTNPDLFILSGLFKDGSDILKRLTDGGYSGKIIIGNGLNTPKIFEWCKLKCDGIYIAQAYNYDWQHRGNEDFKNLYAKYRKDHQDLPEQPSQIMAQIYTAVQVIKEALIAIDQNREKSGRTRLRDLNLNDDGTLDELRQELKDELITNDSEKSSNAHRYFRTPLDYDLWFDQGQNSDIQQDNFCVAKIKMYTEQDGKFEILPQYGPCN